MQALDAVRTGLQQEEYPLRVVDHEATDIAVPLCAPSCPETN